MGRKALTTEEKEVSRQKGREWRHAYFANRKASGMCRQCDQCLSSRSKVFCDKHLEIHTKGCVARRQQNCYSYLQIQARKRGLAFSLTREEVANWTNQKDRYCHYCKQSEASLSGLVDKKARRLTFDRKDNSKGYETGNVCLACNKCNLLKSSFFTEAEWLHIAETVIKPRIEEYHKC